MEKMQCLDINNHEKWILLIAHYKETRFYMFVFNLIHFGIKSHRSAFLIPRLTRNEFWLIMNPAIV